MKPKSLSGFYGRLVLILGGSFLLIGLLSQTGIIKMRTGAHGDPRILSIAGCFFLIVASLFLLIGVYITRRNEFLMQTGTPILGTIISIKQLHFTRFSSSYPYVVYFTYEWEGVQYKGKSGLLWTIPSFKESDQETIYIDAKNPKHSALK